jgi:GntR family transcriptional repressor for pyruvate dehydrogenase complex
LIQLGADTKEGPIESSMVTFTPIERRQTVEAVIESLEERILDGTFSDGDKLPSEEQLATQLGVGRRAVREALKVLEMKGLLEVRMGVGAIVERNDLDSFLDTLTRNVRSYLSINKADARHVMELRWLLEGAALERLVTNPDEDRLRRLVEAVGRQRQAYAAKDSHSYQEWHFCFHHEIIDALGNPVISMIYKQVLALVRGQMERAGSHLEIMGRAIGDHERMIDALKRRSMADLQPLLDIHLANFISDLNISDAVASVGSEADSGEAH